MTHEILFIETVDNLIEINGDKPLDYAEHMFVEWASRNIQQPAHAYWEVKKSRMGAAAVHPVLDAFKHITRDDAEVIATAFGIY
jgi:hypothetical protein